MNNKFVRCDECVYNIGDNNNIICNVMVGEEPVKFNVEECDGCNGGASIEDIFPPIDNEYDFTNRDQ